MKISIRAGARITVEVNNSVMVDMVETQGGVERAIKLLLKYSKETELIKQRKEKFSGG